MKGYISAADLRLKMPEGTETVKVLVDPLTATRWLETEIRNRDLQRISTLSYRADMLAGRWHYTADPIRFDWDGHLIDGKNRLTALALIELPDFSIPFAVARGLDPESQMYMDQGARRSAGQQLGLKGITSGTNIAAGIKLALVWERGQMFSDRWGHKHPVTPIEVVEWAQAHPDVVDLCKRYLQRLRNIGLRPSSGLAFAIRVGVEMPEELELFVNEMSSMANLAEDSPTLVFAKRLARTRNDANLHLNDIDQLGFLIRTWNSWVNGSSRLRLQLPAGGWTENNFPQVVGL